LPLRQRADKPPQVLYFFQKGQGRRTSETRLHPTGEGYQLVVVTDGAEQVETFATLAALLSREHELLQAWRALGWREVPAGPRLSDDRDHHDLDWLSRH
jgi:hypothetical protein